jgi:hypothetical protein
MKGILKDDWWIGFMEGLRAKKNKIINSQENHYYHQSLEGTLGKAFLIKLAIEGIRK